jgi:acetylornithine deacetylase/succinyl-diaminopimelate desuccinylase-like protein
MMSKTLALTEQLIALDSVTPEDKGCQRTLISLLEPLVFIAKPYNPATSPTSGHVAAILSLWSSSLAYRRRADRPGGAMAIGTIHTDPSRWKIVWTWRSRYENLDCRLCGGDRRIHRRPP